MGIGPAHERQLQDTRPFRGAYAERHGWDLVEFTEMDARAQALGDSYSVRARCNLQKLLLPGALARYDLVLFLDADVIVNPDAPCIGIYEKFLRTGDIAAVACCIQQERLPLFGWTHGHYDEIVKAPDGEWPRPPVIRWPELYLNGGVVLYRPREVAERWLSLFTHNCGSDNEEHLLNLFEAQEGRVLWLPQEWNKIWRYEKVRVGINIRGNSLLVRAGNRVLNRYLFKVTPSFEMAMFRRHFPSAHFHHIASEGFKVAKLAKAVSGCLPQSIATTRPLRVRPAMVNAVTEAPA